MKIKVFTFNLRTNSAVDGINVFPNRKGRILDTIRTYAPELIGFQEANNEMREWLREELTDYVVVGCGRNADYRGESVVLAYKKDAFEALWTECFWLSMTPSIPGSTYGMDQSSCPRVTTVACLKHRDAEQPFIFCNTHLDHKGKIARLLGSAQLMQYLSTKPYKFVLTGDFNALPDTPEITAFTEAGITDATSELGGTFHAFGRYDNDRKSKIDYIFTNLPCDKSNSFIIPDEGDSQGIYISDHHPVCATVEI